MKTQLQIQNLKCHGCANTIITQLSKIEGISEINVDNTTDEVHFHYTTETVFEVAKTKLSDLGYPVLGESNGFSKKAKSFVSCAVGRISK